MISYWRVPYIHEASKHSFFTFFLIFLSSHDVSKIWIILFWPRVHTSVAELKLKTSNMQKVTFSISTPPPGGAFELLLHFFYPCNISQKSIIQIFYTLSINKFHWSFAPCISGILNLPNGWSKNQHLTGCGVFSDPNRQWVLHMTKP